MYADHITDSMEKAITETERRRSIQEAYNKSHGIVPKTIIKEIRDLISNIEVNIDLSVSSIEIDASSAIEKDTIKSIIPNCPTSFLPIIL